MKERRERKEIRDRMKVRIERKDDRDRMKGQDEGSG